jgi:two-component sensor histidine kinase
MSPMTPKPQSNAVDRLLRQQAALADFGSYAFREPSLSNILTEAARICADSLGVPYSKICRYRTTENDLLIEAGFGWNAGVLGEVVSKADETSPQGSAFVTGLPVIVPNLFEASNLVLHPLYAEHGIVSTIDVIIKGKDGEPYGVLEIDSPVQHTYDEHDVKFVTGFANILAEAVATSHRNNALQDSIARLKAMVFERDSLVLEKDKLLDERTVLAEELKHRVGNNLQLIHGMLSSHLHIETGRSEKASIQAIIRRVVTLAEVYEQLLGTGMGRTIDLCTYLKSLCDNMPSLQASASPNINLTFTGETLLVNIDTVTAMGMVVAELVSNSYEHAFGPGGGTISVSLRPDGLDSASLMVSDDGRGFIEHGGSKRHGVGLVRRLIEQVGGSADYNARGGSVWTFHFAASLHPNTDLK